MQRSVFLARSQNPFKIWTFILLIICIIAHWIFSVQTYSLLLRNTRKCSRRSRIQESANFWRSVNAVFKNTTSFQKRKQFCSCLIWTCLLTETPGSPRGAECRGFHRSGKISPIFWICLTRLTLSYKLNLYYSNTEYYWMCPDVTVQYNSHSGMLNKSVALRDKQISCTGF